MPPDLRLPEGARVVFAGCGTSFHAAQTGGSALQALEAVLAPPEADLMVCVSHEGETPLTLEAARAFPGPKWLVTGTPDLAARRARRRGDRLHAGARAVVVPHGELHLRGRGDRGAAGRGHLLARRRGRGGARPRSEPLPAQSKILVAGRRPRLADRAGGGAEAARGRWVSAGAHQTEQLLHGHLAAIDESVRAYVLEGEGRAAERAADAVAALRELGCETTLVPTIHPVVDIVRFQLLTVAIADARGIDPDPIHRDHERWARAREAYE